MTRLRASLAVTLIVVIAAFAYTHWLLPAQVESGQNVVIAHEPYTVSPAAQALHESLFVADLHSDSLLWKRDLRERSPIGQMDLPRLADGNVALQVFSATTKSPSGQNYELNEAGSDRITLLAVTSFWPVRTWSSLYERAQYQLDKLHELSGSRGLTLVTSSAGLQELVARRARGERVIGAVYLIEGAHPLEGELANLDRLFGRGLRIVGLTHFFDNELGGSLHGVSGKGLTAFGVSVVRRANELGAIIDIAHASPRMVADVLALSEAPVILSHGGGKSHCDTARNLSDSLMQEIANRGGLLGIGFWDAAICDITPAGIVAAIRHAIDLLGAEHVALGSDYDGAVTVRFDVGELAVITHEMVRSGFTEEEIRMVMGQNVQRFLLEHLP
jgi:microsomal dipeptidase-like Zn-dependent dipeptidase